MLPLFLQRFHADDEEALVDGVYLNEESLTMITQLFKVSQAQFSHPHITSSLPLPQLIDRNSDGKLDVLDFSLDGTYANTHFKKWQELRQEFDLNGDGQVTLDEVG